MINVINERLNDIFIGFCLFYSYDQRMKGKKNITRFAVTNRNDALKSKFYLKTS